MKNFNYIDIEHSTPDNRTLILPHQQAAVDAMTTYFHPNTDVPDRSGVVVMPTGSGKTFTSVRWLLSEGVANGYRIVWLVHRKELVQQTYNEFVRQAPILRCTSVKKLQILPVSGDSKHAKMSVASRADVYVCSIASVANRYGYRFIERMLGAQGKRRVIVVIDEAHHAVAANYQKVLKRITSLNPNRVLLGLTATPKRMQAYDQYRLQKLFHIDENIRRGIGKRGYVYEVSFADLLASRFLARPIRVPVETKLHGEIEFEFTPEDEAYFAVHHDFSEKMKNKIGRSSARNTIILNQYLAHKEEYGKTIIFALDQNHAKTLYMAFKEAGVRCDYAVSERSDAQDVIRRFKGDGEIDEDSKIDVLINVMMMTEGSDIPDIQTVFLTRETNSEALLNQMIGRGLRGPKAKGTETAYIVYFRDMWEKFSTLNPGALEIFADADDDIPAETEPLPEIETDQEGLAALAEKIFDNKEKRDLSDSPAAEEDAVTEWDVYLKLYEIMKANLTAEEKQPSAAIGWYSVIDENGEDVKLLVFDTQMDAYEKIKRNLTLLFGKATPQLLLRVYFDGCPVMPDENELQYLIDAIDDTHQMPDFFALSAAKAVDIRAIREKMDTLYEKDEDKETWLKKLFDSTPIIRQIYHVFYAFKKTVFDYTDTFTREQIVEINPDNEDYVYEENHFDLPELLREVIAQYPKLTVDNLILIDWSHSFVRKWLALCTENPTDGKLFFQLHINRFLSTPQLTREHIKYLIFHELLHSNGYWEHDLHDFRAREWQYPNAAELDADLDRFTIDHNIDSVLADFIDDEHYEIIPLPKPESQVDGEAEETDRNTEEPKKVADADHEDVQPFYNKHADGVEEGSKYCRNCGNKLPGDAQFCNRCGKQTNY